MTVFGDVNVSVYRNSDVLKFTFTLKCVLLENQKCNYFNHLMYIAALYLLFISVSFIKGILASVPTHGFSLNFA